MARASNTHTLSDFQRNAKRHIERLRKTGRPHVLTVNGEPQVVVQDAAAYEKLLDELDEAQAVAGIRRGLESMKRGHGRPMREFLEELGRAHGIELTKRAVR